jgi:hypothetical protein
LSEAPINYSALWHEVVPTTQGRFSERTNLPTVADHNNFAALLKSVFAEKTTEWTLASFIRAIKRREPNWSKFGDDGDMNSKMARLFFDMSTAAYQDQFVEQSPLAAIASPPPVVKVIAN